MHEKRFDASMAHRLDHPERLAWLPPQDVVRALDVKGGATVADLGAGTGYFALPLASAVGANGRVIAVDAQQEMLDHLRRKIAAAAVSNIELVCAEADRTSLPGASANLVFLANVWHEIPDRAAVLAEVRRILNPRGRVAILDWRPDVPPDHGPPLEHRLSAASAAEELIAAGYHALAQQNVGRYAWLVQAAAEG